MLWLVLNGGRLDLAAKGGVEVGEGGSDVDGRVCRR